MIEAFEFSDPRPWTAPLPMATETSYLPFQRWLTRLSVVILDIEAVLHRHRVVRSLSRAIHQDVSIGSNLNPLCCSRPFPMLNLVVQVRVGVEINGAAPVGEDFRVTEGTDTCKETGISRPPPRPSSSPYEILQTLLLKKDTLSGRVCVSIDRCQQFLI